MRMYAFKRFLWDYLGIFTKYRTNDKDTHKDKYKDKEKKKLPRRKGSCIKASIGTVCCNILGLVLGTFSNFAAERIANSSSRLQLIGD